MTIKASTGLINKALDTGSYKFILSLGFLDIYAGTPPATADASISGFTKLCRVSVASGGTGLSLGTATGGSLPKATETWSGVNLATGVATFYRFVAPGDTGVLSTTEARIQGAVGTAGADLNLTAGTSLTSGLTLPINYFSLSIAIPS